MEFSNSALVSLGANGIDDNVIKSIAKVPYLANRNNPREPSSTKELRYIGNPRDDSGIEGLAREQARQDQEIHQT